MEQHVARPIARGFSASSCSSRCLRRRPRSSPCATRFTSSYALPEARLAFDTAVAVVATIVAVLASIRFVVEGRLLDLLLAAGFWSIALGTAAFGLVPLLGGGTLDAGSRVVAHRIADSRRGAHRGRAVHATASSAIAGVRSSSSASASRRCSRPSPSRSARRPGQPARPEACSAVDGASVVVAAVLARRLSGSSRSSASRSATARYGRDLDSWMCLAATLALFGDLPPRS